MACCRIANASRRAKEQTDPSVRAKSVFAPLVAPANPSLGCAKIGSMMALVHPGLKKPFDPTGKR